MGLMPRSIHAFDEPRRASKGLALAGRLLSFTSLIAVVALGACRSPSLPMPLEERAETEAEVRSALEAFAEAQERLDAEAAIAFLAPDFRMYVDGVATDYDTVVQGIRTTLPGLQRLESNWSDVEVMVLTKDHAIVSLVFQDTATTSDGSKERSWGPTTLLWSRLDGVFRIHYADADHYPVRMR